MVDRRSRVHVAIGESATGSLRIAFRRLGCAEPVLCLPDDLAMGPVASSDPLVRARWLAEEIHEQFEAPPMEAFWGTLRSLASEVVVWMSRRSTSEYCGLLELVWQMEDVPLSVIDVADIELHGRDRRAMPFASCSFGFVSDTQIVNENLLARATAISPETRAGYRAEWARLREDDAELRVLTQAGLMSAPISYFDDRIIEFVADEWTKCGRVIGGALSAVSDGPFVQIANDSFFFTRLLRLIDGEVVEGRRDDESDDELWSYRTSSVRRRRGMRGD